MKHDAMFECPADGLPPKSVGVVVKCGWTHGEALIRFVLFIYFLLIIVSYHLLDLPSLELLVAKL